MDSQDRAAGAAVQAIRTGDTAVLSALLSENPGLANAHIHGSRTPLLVAADWPGYVTGGPTTVRLLIEACTDQRRAQPACVRAESRLHRSA